MYGIEWTDLVDFVYLIHCLSRETKVGHLASLILGHQHVTSSKILQATVDYSTCTCTCTCTCHVGLLIAATSVHCSIDLTEKKIVTFHTDSN